MHEAMPLLNAAPVWDVNLGKSRLHDGQGGPDELHGGLPLEAGPDTLGEVKIGISGHVAWSIQIGTRRRSDGIPAIRD
jgi:hypothetical protein